MNESEKKQLAETISLQLKTDIQFESNEAKIVKLYAYTMLFFEENSIKPSVDNFVKNKHDIEVYIKNKTKSDIDKGSNVINPTKSKNNKGLKNFIAIVIICILLYTLIKKQ